MPYTYHVHSRIGHSCLGMPVNSTGHTDLMPPSALPLSNHQKSQQSRVSFGVFHILFILSYIIMMQAFVTFLLCHCNCSFTGLLPSLTRLYPAPGLIFLNYGSDYNLYKYFPNLQYPEDPGWCCLCIQVLLDIVEIPFQQHLQVVIKHRDQTGAKAPLAFQH